MSRVCEPLNPTEAHTLQPWVAHYYEQRLIRELQRAKEAETFWKEHKEEDKT